MNLQIMRAESLIEQALTSLPVGTAYYILRAKMFEIQKLYYQQAQEEYAAAQAKNSQTQAKGENERAAEKQEEQ